MRFTLALAFVTGSALVSATLDPARSNTKGMCLSNPNCKVTKVSTAIQAAECSHNTRTHKKQTYAVFVTDHQYDGNHGYPYGNCSAYTCEVPIKKKMVKNCDCWTFFWTGDGNSTGIGTDCVKHPKRGVCGCQDSLTGTFHTGRTDCV